MKSHVTKKEIMMGFGKGTSTSKNSGKVNCLKNSKTTHNPES
ncbi:hypothetical protein Mp_4g20330 [Marchantia polymorpha subsp. ruderalis]|uniref:Uncharacterized protein n=1 Tax=Marchantia polymorpha subsp. ruderalis TaxID=1480154 RepID=A0AAF6BBX9_MARPO|nr:hypothetical protein Mp_4g20330 [Marchantia polymorpha subsp. ruderalis]